MNIIETLTFFVITLCIFIISLEVFKRRDDFTVYSTRIKSNILKILNEYNSSNIFSSVKTRGFKLSILFYFNISL